VLGVFLFQDKIVNARVATTESLEIINLNIVMGEMCWFHLLHTNLLSTDDILNTKNIPGVMKFEFQYENLSEFQS
jgi:hypothetical protein